METQEYERLRVFVSNLLEWINDGDNYKLLADEDIFRSDLENVFENIVAVVEIIYYKYRTEFKNLNLGYDINNSDFRKEIYNQLYDDDNGLLKKITKWLFPI